MTDLIIFIVGLSSLYVVSLIEMNIGIKWFIVSSLFIFISLTTANAVDKRDKMIYNLADKLEKNGIAIDNETFFFLEDIKLKDN